MQIIEALPSDEETERDFDIEKRAEEYARGIKERIARTRGEVLFIDVFGQADFMGGYTR